MIKSMTGFAAVEHEDDAASLSVTVRSVNHRYLDAQLRLPPVLAEVEGELRSLVQQQVARGRVEVTLAFRLKVPPTVEIDLNESLAAALATAADTARSRGWAEGGLSTGELLRFPQVVHVREKATDDTIWEDVRRTVMRVTTQALDDLDRMRRTEGQFLAADLEERVGTLRGLVERIVEETEAGETALRERLMTRIDELGTSTQTEPNAVAQEVVRWVARSDIHEEVARLRGHLDHVASLAVASEPCGRKLDFLAQEMNREVNTIGSKAEGPGTGQLIVSAKAELEKLREQLQNVE